MAMIPKIKRFAAAMIAVVLSPALAKAQGGFVAQGAEYKVAGTWAGEQVYPHSSIKTTGGYVVWQDNITDGDGYGISGRKLDGSFSGSLSTFVVNANGTDDQERPQVTMLNDGGAIFIWQSGRQSFQNIYGRVRNAAGVWGTGDILINSSTNFYQRDAALTTLSGGNVVVVYSSYNQVAAGSMQDVYAQILTPTGAKSGGEFTVNTTTAFNQRSAAIAPLSDGRFVVVWISEQQRFENSADVYARIYAANGTSATSEFLINSSTNICANPTVAPSADGGFLVTWMQLDLAVSTNSWDVFARPFSGAANGGVTRRVNTFTYGDQLAPKVSSIASDYQVVWTSMGQDGSDDGVYGQFLKSDGSLSGTEFRVNTSTPSQQMHPTVCSDGVGTFLTVWSGFVGGANAFDLFSQRYVSTNAALNAPGAPIVTVLSSNTLSVSWPPVQGISISNYEVYADGDITASAVVTNTYWNSKGLAAGSTHSYKLAYVVADGRRSPLSVATTNTTYLSNWFYDQIAGEWMTANFGNAYWAWPQPGIDSDGDGASNLNEFLAGTNPNDANSVLKVRLQPTPQGLFLNWNTQIGLIYQVQQSTSVNSWSNLGGPRFASGSVDSMYVTGGNATFYRIVRLR